MGLFIKGMEMPKSGEKIIILTSSGYIEDVSGQVIEGVEAISVPTPHGCLIDADELLTDANKLRYGKGWLITVENIEAAPTIIEAEE